MLYQSRPRYWSDTGTLRKRKLVKLCNVRVWNQVTYAATCNFISDSWCDINLDPCTWPNIFKKEQSGTWNFTFGNSLKRRELKKGTKASSSSQRGTDRPNMMLANQPCEPCLSDITYLTDGEFWSTAPRRCNVSHWPLCFCGFEASSSKVLCLVAAGTHGHAAVSKLPPWRRDTSTSKQLSTSVAFSRFLVRVTGGGWSSLSLLLTRCWLWSSRLNPGHLCTPPASTHPWVVVRSCVVAWMYVRSKHKRSRRCGFEASLVNIELMRWSFSCISSGDGQVWVGNPSSVHLLRLPRHALRCSHSSPSTPRALLLAPAAANSAPAAINNSRSSSDPQNGIHWIPMVFFDIPRLNDDSRCFCCNMRVWNQVPQADTCHFP